jgi:hypothetical protein
LIAVFPVVALVVIILGSKRRRPVPALVPVDTRNRRTLR